MGRSGLTSRLWVMFKQIFGTMSSIGFLKNQEVLFDCIFVIDAKIKTRRMNTFLKAILN